MTDRDLPVSLDRETDAQIPVCWDEVRGIMTEKSEILHKLMLSSAPALTILLLR